MFDPEKVLIGIAPTGWTNDDLPELGADISFEQCVSEMALAGFQGCGLGHKAPGAVNDLLRALELRGLRVSGTWFGTYFTAAGMEERTMASFRQTATFLEQVGASHVVMAELGNAVHLQPIALMANTPRFTDEQWRALVRGLRRLAADAADRGLILAYHPHVGTGVQGIAEIDRLMDACSDDGLTLLLDTGHLAYAGEDPVEVTRTYADRICHVHLKDVRRDVLERCLTTGTSFRKSIHNDGQSVFTVPGDGDIDFQPILGALDVAHFEGWLVVEAEQDPCKAEPLQYAMKARAYLREIIGW